MYISASRIALSERTNITHDFTDTERHEALEFLFTLNGQRTSCSELFDLDSFELTNYDLEH